MSESEVVEGVVRADRAPVLRVEGTVQEVSGERTAAVFVATLQRIWATRKAAGLGPRTHEVIDAQIEEFRKERNERIEPVGRLQEDQRLTRGSPTRQEVRNQPRGKGGRRDSTQIHR